MTVQSSDTALRMMKRLEGALIHAESQRYSSKNTVQIEWDYRLNDEGKSYPRRSSALSAAAFNKLLEQKHIEPDPSREINRDARWIHIYYVLTAAARDLVLPELKLTDAQVSALARFAMHNASAYVGYSGSVNFYRDGENASRYNTVPKMTVQALINLGLLDQVRETSYFAINQAGIDAYNKAAAERGKPTFEALTAANEEGYAKMRDAAYQRQIVATPMGAGIIRYHRRNATTPAIVMNTGDHTWSIDGAFSYGEEFVYASELELETLFRDVKECVREERKERLEAAAAARIQAQYADRVKQDEEAC